MDEMMMHGAEPREILEAIIKNQTPAIMSYLSKGKWHVAKMILTKIGANRFFMEASPRKKPYPININVGQSMGLSIKYGYGKFVFESTVMDLLAGSQPGSSGEIAILIPPKINVISRRSYFRVTIPDELHVDAMFWHRRCSDSERETEAAICSHGRLIDISAGGAQLVASAAKGFDFNKGQFIGVKFIPMPYDKPLIFTAQIRNILPTADGNNYCLGLQIVGLEASDEGMGMLRRLCNVVENYYLINKSSIKQRDFKTTSVEQQ